MEAAILPVSLTAGVNLYLTLFVLGLGDRLAWLDLPDELSFLGSLMGLALSGVFLLIEFFADKIPYVDSVWDFLHTFVRPAGAIALALNFIPPEQAELQGAAMLIAGSTALTSHGGKASLRALINTSPEPVTNSAVSVLEDTLVLGLLALAINYPVFASVVAAILIVVIIAGIYLNFKLARRTFGSVRQFFSRKPKPIPAEA